MLKIREREKKEERSETFSVVKAFHAVVPLLPTFHAPSICKQAKSP